MRSAAGSGRLNNLAALPVRPANRHDGAMEPNLVRIPAGGDARAEAIVLRAGETINRRLLDTLDERDYLALGRYGASL